MDPDLPRQVIANAIAKSDTDIRSHLHASIHLAGGTTLLKGFGDRLLSEAPALPPSPIPSLAPSQLILVVPLGVRACCVHP